jgi:hypothetical protein
VKLLSYPKYKPSRERLTTKAQRHKEVDSQLILFYLSALVTLWLLTGINGDQL